jgi:hypothetical protein
VVVKKEKGHNIFFPFLWLGAALPEFKNTRLESSMPNLVAFEPSKAKETRIGKKNGIFFFLRKRKV